MLKGSLRNNKDITATGKIFLVDHNGSDGSGRDGDSNNNFSSDFKENQPKSKNFEPSKNSFLKII